jgi:hypothetical protein
MPWTVFDNNNNRLQYNGDTRKRPERITHPHVPEARWLDAIHTGRDILRQMQGEWQERSRATERSRKS